MAAGAEVGRGEDFGDLTLDQRLELIQNWLTNEGYTVQVERNENEIVVMARPRAAEAVPWNAGPVMWPSMLAGLPELPPELEYRFLGQHLILIDALANLVVDVLYDALPEPEVSSS